MSNFLTIDLGTTTVKAYILNLEKGLVGKYYTKYESIKPAKGLHEQDPSVWWIKIKESIKGVLAKTEIDKSEIAAISIVSQRGTVLPIDTKGKPLFNALTWMDTRKPELPEDQKQKVAGRIGLEKILWFKQAKPELYEKTLKFVLPDSYLTAILVGKTISSPSQAVYLFYDETKGDYDYETLEELGVDADKLPIVKRSDTVVGELNTEIASELGLKARTPIILGSGDQQAAALGLGVINPGKIKITLGTGLFIDAASDNRVIEFYDQNLKIFCLPHAIERKWLVEATIPGLGQTLEWFARNFAGDIRERASSLKIEPLSLLDEEASEIKPELDSPIFIPLASFGLGSWINISIHHSRSMLYRSILDSAGFASKFFLELLSGLGIEINEIYVEGGGSGSKTWLRILSNIIQRPIKLTKSRDYAAGLGGAIIATLALKEIKDPKRIIEEMSEISETVEPADENLEIYENLFEAFVNNLLEGASKL